MRTFSFFFVILLIVSSIGFVSCNTKTKQNKDPSNWIQLLSDDNLDNWTVKISGYEIGNNYGNTFHMEDGILKVRYNSEYYPKLLC